MSKILDENWKTLNSLIRSFCVFLSKDNKEAKFDLHCSPLKNSLCWGVDEYEVTLQNIKTCEKFFFDVTLTSFDPEEQPKVFKVVMTVNGEPTVFSGLELEQLALKLECWSEKFEATVVLVKDEDISYRVMTEFDDSLELPKGHELKQQQACSNVKQFIAAQKAYKAEAEYRNESCRLKRVSIRATQELSKTLQS